MLVTILIVILVLVLVGSLPPIGMVNAGYAPSGLLAVIVIVLLILLLTGRL